MRILFVAQRVPYPPDRGDKITTYNEIRHLARHHEVVVACLADGESDLANVEQLETIAASVDVAPLRPNAARFRALGALFRGLPCTVEYFNESVLYSKIAARVQEERFDVIIVYSSGVAQFVEAYGEVPRILQFADLDSLKWNQYALQSRFPRSWLYRREYRLLLEYERRLARTFTHSLVCTTAELEDFQRLIPGMPVSCVGNGVDLDYFKPTGRGKKANELIFTGVMDYFPNVDGIIWFSEQILPLIRREVPGVTLTICGSRPTTQVRALSRLPGVNVTGWVPDVRPFLEQAAVCVVPLRIARGIQNKLLEAMAMGIPTVACSPAFSGVEALPGRDLEVADDPVAFACATARLLLDEELRRRMGESARRSVEANYRWDHQLEQLDRVLALVTSTGQ